MADETTDAQATGDVEYTPVKWANGAAGKTPVSAANLDRIEKGVADCAAKANANAADLRSVRDSVSQRVRTTGTITDSYLSADATLATPQRIKITVTTSDGNQYLAVFADTYVGLYDVVGKRWVWQMRP